MRSESKVITAKQAWLEFAFETLLKQKSVTSLLRDFIFVLKNSLLLDRLAIKSFPYISADFTPNSIIFFRQK